MAQQIQRPGQGEQFGRQSAQFGYGPQMGGQMYGPQMGGQMYGPQTGGQMGYGGQMYGPQTGMQGVRGAGFRLQDVETPQQRAAVDAIVRAMQTTEWCADQCVQLGDQNVSECIRLCEDVSELGEVALTLIPRNSRFAQQAVQTLLQVVQTCGQECSRHGHAHCQECAQVLSNAEASLSQFVGGASQQWQGDQRSTGYL